MGRFVLAAGVGCLLLAGAALWRAESGRREAAAESRAQRQALDALEEDVAALERRVRARTMLPVRVETAPSPAGQLPDANAGVAALAARIEDLHERISALEARLSGQRQRRPEPPPPSEAELLAARSIALDRRGAAKSRVTALKTLRLAEHGRSLEVALATLELIDTPEVDPDLRSDAISELKGLRFPEIKDPMLAMLGKLDHEDTRKEAVQVLRGYLDDPAVLQALTRVRDHDPSGEVRREASQRIQEWQAGKEWGWRGK
jgi:HEAT repeats